MFVCVRFFILMKRWKWKEQFLNRPSLLISYKLKWISHLRRKRWICLLLYHHSRKYNCQFTEKYLYLCLQSLRKILIYVNFTEGNSCFQKYCLQPTDWVQWCLLSSEKSAPGRQLIQLNAKHISLFQWHPLPVASHSLFTVKLNAITPAGYAAEVKNYL